MRFLHKGDPVIRVVTAQGASGGHGDEHRCRAAKIVPDPGGELAAYLLRQAIWI